MSLKCCIEVQALSIPREVAMRPDGAVLNLASKQVRQCWHSAAGTSSVSTIAVAGAFRRRLQVIAELLRFLKRSYWPFAWDTSAGVGNSTGEPPVSDMWSPVLCIS